MRGADKPHTQALCAASNQEFKMKNEAFINLILPVITSKSIGGYVIGITKSTNNRRQSYKRIGWEYFYIVETDLTQMKALKLEKQYFDYVTSDRSSIFYKKYQTDKRDEEHRASVGGISKQTVGDKVYSIYIACYA